MRGTRRMLLLMIVIGVLTASVSLVASAAAPGPVLSVPLRNALTTPIPVGLALGEPAIVRLERPVTVVSDSPPGIVHPILHGSAVLLVPVREGSTLLTLGLGDGVSAKLALSIGTGAGARVVTLTGFAAADPVPRPTPVAPLRRQPDPASRANAAVADPPSGGVDALIATMSADQRQALVNYLQSPSLESLSTVVRLLSPSQQHMLVQVLASHSPLSQGAAQAPQAAPPAVAPLPSTVTATSTTQPAKADSVDPGVTVSAPDGIALHVLTMRTGGILYLSYVVQNHTGRTLRADPHDIDVAGADGAITVRQMDVGTPGEIAEGSLETGVIALTPASARISVTWRLRDDAGDAVSVGILVTNQR